MRIFSPGRVNLIGDHTDYTGGFVLPMAIDRGLTLDIERCGPRIELTSDRFDEPATIELPQRDPDTIEPRWARYVAGVAAELGAVSGFSGTITSDLPVAGLSSSAALEVGVALALGYEGSRTELALACQRAEQRASGVPCGIMDQLTIATAEPGRAMLIDCRSLDVSGIEVPDDLEVVVVHSGEHRELIDSAYGERRRQCEAAEDLIGPLRHAERADAETITDPLLQKRARHVISENERVLRFVHQLQARNYKAAGSLMNDSHDSLRDDFEVSTPTLDNLVDELRATSGVFGARLTGAGFGGAVVALTEPGSLDVGFAVRPAGGARVVAP